MSCVGMFRSSGSPAASFSLGWVYVLRMRSELVEAFGKHTLRFFSPSRAGTSPPQSCCHGCVAVEFLAAVVSRGLR